MIEFRVGHATHPDWRAALVLAATQLDAGSPAQEVSPAGPPSLGFVYFTEPYAPHATALLAALRERWPGTSWVGSVGVGVCATGVEYTDEPALVLMLANLPRARFEVFSGVSKLQHIEAWTALVHADPRTPDLGELIDELSDRTGSGYLFGGLSAAQGTAVHVADGVWQGGLSGVAFTRDVALISRVTQGSQPLGPTRTITACERNIVTALDGQPALPLPADRPGAGLAGRPAPAAAASARHPGRLDRRA
jgi:small ligand-binding sensory domain FIST